MAGLHLRIFNSENKQIAGQSSYKKQSKLDMAVLLSVLWLGMHFDECCTIRDYLRMSNR